MMELRLKPPKLSDLQTTSDLISSFIDAERSLTISKLSDTLARSGPQLELPAFPDITDIIDSIKPVIKDKSHHYKDDWRICPNCGFYYIEPHICVSLWEKFANDPSQSDS